MWKWWSPSNPAGSRVMAQHWGGLHAITALFHNWLVSRRGRVCRYAGWLAGMRKLQHLPQAGMGMIWVWLCILSNVLPVEKYGCPFVYVSLISWTSCADTLYIACAVFLLSILLEIISCSVIFLLHNISTGDIFMPLHFLTVPTFMNILHR